MQRSSQTARTAARGSWRKNGGASNNAIKAAAIRNLDILREKSPRRQSRERGRDKSSNCYAKEGGRANEQLFTSAIGDGVLHIGGRGPTQ